MKKSNNTKKHRIQAAKRIKKALAHGQEFISVGKGIKFRIL